MNGFCKSNQLLLRTLARMVLTCFPATRNLIPAPPNQSLSTTATTPIASGAEVSWQSVLWGLVALSLNAMTQRSGADRSPSSDPLSPARTSPFICIAEMVVLILWLIKG